MLSAGLTVAGDGAQRITSLIYSSENQTIDCMSDAGDKLNNFKVPAGNFKALSLPRRTPSSPHCRVCGRARSNCLA